MWLTCGLQIYSRNTSVLLQCGSSPSQETTNISGKQQAERTAMKQTVLLGKECSEVFFLCVCVLLLTGKSSIEADHTIPKLTEDKGYKAPPPHQKEVFNVDRICLHWKELALQITISKEKDEVFSLTVAKSRPALPPGAT